MLSSMRTTTGDHIRTTVGSKSTISTMKPLVLTRTW